MKVFSIKSVTKKDAYDILGRTFYRPTSTRVYLCFLGKPIKLLYHYGIRYRQWIVPGARCGMYAASTCIDSKVEGKYILVML